MNKYKKILSNSFFNIFASLLPVLILQLIVYPLLSRRLSLDTYGDVITFTGIAMLLIQVSGTGINNTRIIMNSEYKEKKLIGDFNIIAALILFINLLISLPILFFLNDTILSFNILFLFFFIELGFLNMYLTSEFNINMNYNRVLIANIWLTIGYLIGLILFLYIGQWSIIFFTGMLFVVAYQLLHTNYWKSGFNSTEMFTITLKKIIIISFSSLMLSIITYGDRVFLYPILGAANVAIFYTASQFGKLIGMGLNPIASVLLSFFSQSKTMSKKTFWLYNIGNFLMSAVFFILSLFLSKPILTFLYPTITSEASRYITVANIAAILTASSGLIQPIILKFCPTRWQVYIQLTNIIVYFGLGILFTYNWGLMGFCISNIIAAVCRIVIQLIMGNISLSKMEEIK